MKLEGIKDNILTYVKYIYLLLFFALLSGLFYPIINKKYPDKVFTGTMILWVGLAGALLMYRATKEEDDKKKLKLIILGGVIMAGDVFFMFAASGIFG
jgi:membrane associated rhomboid family serine protease